LEQYSELTLSLCSVQVIHLQLTSSIHSTSIINLYVFGLELTPYPSHSQLTHFSSHSANLQLLYPTSGSEA